MHQARLPGAGLDCGGVIVCPALTDGRVYIEDTTRYSRQPWSRRLKAFCQHTLYELPNLQACGPASIVLFWVARPKIQQHLALLTDRGTMIHAWFEQRKVVENELDAWWIDHIDSVFDYRLPCDAPEAPWQPSS